MDKKNLKPRVKGRARGGNDRLQRCTMEVLNHDDS